MEPSKQVGRRTDKELLGKRLNDVAKAKKGVSSYNEQVLWEYSLDSETTCTDAVTRDLFTGSQDQDWTWMEPPKIVGMVPWLIFLYGGLFVFENDSKSKESLEAYDCPQGCSKICLAKNSRVLVIYTKA